MSWRTPLLATLLLALAGVLLLRRHHGHPRALILPAAPMHGEPRTMLWAWATPEDLRSLDPARTGVAFLSRELLLSDRVTVRPRLQPLALAPGTWLMAVVRLQPTASFTPSPALRAATLQALLAALSSPNVRAIQLDFDATSSQRAFYLALLHDLRADLPPGLPLSITALVSWCGPNSWLPPTPAIDEAVPMFFRMGGPSATRSSRPRSTTAITAAPCAGSIGLSTDEQWPIVSPSQRVYLFHPGPWTKEEIASINRIGYVGGRAPQTP